MNIEERLEKVERIISDLLTMIDAYDKNEDTGFSMHTYGQTPDWYVEAAYESCFLKEEVMEQIKELYILSKMKSIKPTSSVSLVI